jgi:hypothetical protein
MLSAHCWAGGQNAPATSERKHDARAVGIGGWKRAAPSGLKVMVHSEVTVVIFTQILTSSGAEGIGQRSFHQRMAAGLLESPHGDAALSGHGGGQGARDGGVAIDGESSGRGSSRADGDLAGRAGSRDIAGSADGPRRKLASERLGTVDRKLSSSRACSWSCANG